MKPLKRGLIAILLAWATSIIILSLIAASYYLDLQKEKQKSTEYENMYNGLLGNYTDLLHEYFNLLQKSESEKQNLTELLEEYQSCIMKVNICIDYGNGTVEWFNKTEMPPGSSLFDLLTKVANVTYTYWPTLEPGHILIDSINDVGGEKGHYWLWYYWNSKTSKWNENSRYDSRS